ncbi:MAG: hypothetical protein ABTQ29_11660 [Siculibacillus sp.]
MANDTSASGFRSLVEQIQERNPEPQMRETRRDTARGNRRHDAGRLETREDRGPLPSALLSRRWL